MPHHVRHGTGVELAAELHDTAPRCWHALRQVSVCGFVMGHVLLMSLGKSSIMTVITFDRDDLGLEEQQPCIILVHLALRRDKQKIRKQTTRIKFSGMADLRVRKIQESEQSLSLSSQGEWWESSPDHPPPPPPKKKSLAFSIQGEHNTGFFNILPYPNRIQYPIAAKFVLENRRTHYK